MDFLEARVPSEAVLCAMHQNAGSEKEEDETSGNGNPFQHLDHRASSRKGDEFLSLGGDDGDPVESVAMDLISRQSEHPDDRHEDLYHHDA